MWRRFPDVTRSTVFIISVCLCLNIIVKYSDCQELPTRDSDYAFGINQKDLFYDNNRIPDGIQVSPYLFVNTTKKYFFLLDSKIERLEISVSPCASPVVWHVTYKPQRDKNLQYELGNDVEEPVVGFNPVSKTNDVLYTVSGEVAETLRIDQPDIGIYTLDITSTQTDSYVQIYATTSPDVERLPELPIDKNISQLDTNSKGFTVAWNQSPDERHLGDDIEYCIAINRKRSYKTLCSVLSHLNGDVKPTLPPDSGFGFSSDVYKKRVLKQRAKPISAAKKGSIFYECIGKQTKFTYDKIKKGKGFYVDIFVKHKKSEHSKYLNGIYIKTRRRRRRIPTLKEGRNKTVVFTKKRKIRSYIFVVKHSTKDVHLAISSCTGTTNIELKTINGTFLQTNVKTSKVLTLKNLTKGKYLIVLTKKGGRRRQSVYISLNTKSKNVRIPKLPKDTTVKVFDYLTSCNSITVAWTGTNKKQNYCLYKTEIPSTTKSSSIFKKLNQCGAQNRLDHNSQLITCKRFRYRSKDKSVLAITVTNLKPDTSYIFDVFVNKGNYFSFPYNSVRTKTSSTCYLPT